MEYAIRIISSTEEQLVTITEMQQKGEEARGYNYQCPDNYCCVKVHVTFPEEKKSGRKEAHRPYFSARGKSHEKFCQRDRMFVLRDTLTARVRRMKLPPEVEALLDTYPQRFDESAHTDRVKKNEGDVSTGDVSQIGAKDGTKGSSSGQSSPDERKSIRGSRFLEEFVCVYEALPKLRRQLPIRIRFCPAKTYEAAFMDVADAVDNQGIAVARHIYYGTYYRREEYEGGVAIYFKGSSGDGKPLGIWIPAAIGSRTQELKDEIFDRLEKAQNEPASEQTARIYAIGRFEPIYVISRSDPPDPPKIWKYSLEVTHLGQLWVSFRSDLPQQP